MDHVPPAQIYASGLRTQDIAKNLFTLPAHKDCNKQYQRDEDYFVQSIGPLAYGSQAGTALWKDLSGRIQRTESQGLAMKVYHEFQFRSPGGIHAPSGKVFKLYDGERVRCVLWKITRGLYFKHYGRFLPSDHFKVIEMIEPERTPPAELVQLVQSLPSRGQHQGVFDYKFCCVETPDKLHLWMMLFWDRVVAWVGFYDPLGKD